MGTAISQYPTLHPCVGMNEQRPEDWWNAVVASALKLRRTNPAAYRDVAAIALSGHSLGALPLDNLQTPLQHQTPIWSDTRGEPDAAKFFQSFSEDSWYVRTGNGFARGLYPAFKLLWLRRVHPEIFTQTVTVMGAKDYINLRLTGEIATDHSYASGSGFYNLDDCSYDTELLEALGLDRETFPEPIESHDRIGSLTPDAAATIGLPASTIVFAGGVDNACMAVGSELTSTGRAYVSLGSSSWVTVGGSKPVLDTTIRPFVFRHMIPGNYISALSTFSTGTSFEWARRELFGDASPDAVISEALRSDVGAGGVSFVPALAGGTPIEGGSEARGAFLGISIDNNRSDIARAVMEGIALSLARSLDLLERFGSIERPILLTGGGSRSVEWNAMYASVMNASLKRTSVVQDAATLGAATCAFVGLGNWDSYVDADRAHELVETVMPDVDAVRRYVVVRERFTRDCSANIMRTV